MDAEQIAAGIIAQSLAITDSVTGKVVCMQKLLRENIAAAIVAERERCAKIADAEEERHKRGSPVSSMAEDVWGANAAKLIAEAIRDDRVHGQGQGDRDK